MRLIFQHSILCIIIIPRPMPEPDVFIGLRNDLWWFSIIINNKSILKPWSCLHISIKVLQTVHRSTELTVLKQWNLMFKTFDVMLCDWMFKSCFVPFSSKNFSKLHTHSEFGTYSAGNYHYYWICFFFREVRNDYWLWNRVKIENRIG